jgi:hypothetical protein
MLLLVVVLLALGSLGVMVVAVVSGVAKAKTTIPGEQKNNGFWPFCMLILLPIVTVAIVNHLSGINFTSGLLGVTQNSINNLF